MTPTTYSASDVARLLGVSRSHITTLAARDGHVLGCRAIRVGRRLLFSRVALDAALAEYTERVA